MLVASAVSWQLTRVVQRGGCVVTWRPHSYTATTACLQQQLHDQCSMSNGMACNTDTLLASPVHTVMSASLVSALACGLKCQLPASVSAAACTHVCCGPNCLALNVTSC